MFSKLSLSLLGLIFIADAVAADSPPDNSTVDPLHLSWLDKTIAPGDNFYAFANGSWQKQNPIPEDYSSWSSFTAVNKKNQKIIHEMLIAAAANPSAPAGSIERKIGDFYFAGMDVERINALGAKPLQPLFDKIQAISSLVELQSVMTELQMMGVDVFFDINSMQDFKNSKEMIGIISQAGLGLPDRDYYLKDDKKFQKIREAYVEHIAKMFELLGDTAESAHNYAKRIMEIETSLARVSMSQIEQRDPHAIYHPMSIDKLKSLAPNLSWSKYLKDLDLERLNSINVAMPQFFHAMDAELKQRSLDDWKIYLRWHLIDAFAPYLSAPFVDENFKMVSVMTGTKNYNLAGVEL